MPLDEPAWWYADAADWRAALLKPLGQLYGWAAERRFHGAEPYRPRVPVVCIGNFTAGGTGKTPLSLMVAGMLAAAGRKPAFLTRGYGGRIAGPAFIDCATQNAAETGDEPRLLAATAPTVVSRDRAAGARLIAADGRFDVIVMDDGFQNPAVAKDLALALVDRRRGVGNGEVIPAGPLRAPLEFQLGLADAVVVTGSGEGNSAPSRVHDALRRGFTGPVLEVRSVPKDDAGWLAGQRVLAFAGIANPDRFFRLLEENGAVVAARRTFADHHMLTAAEAAELLRAAESDQLRLVTTEKDHVRLDAADDQLKCLKDAAAVLPIRLEMSERDRLRLEALIDGLRRPEPAA